MSSSNPSESFDAEGLPVLEDHPPGLDIETDEEGMIPPRDYPIAAGADPAYATTAAEERVRESVAARADREEPDVGAAELGVGGSPSEGGEDGGDPGGGRADIDDEDDDDEDAGGDGGYVLGATSAGPRADLATAVAVDEPLPADLRGDATDDGDPVRGLAGELIEPDSGEGFDSDHEPTLVALQVEDDEAAPSAEEAAVHITDDDLVR